MDWSLVQERMGNSENPAIAPHCYRGGQKDIDHDINQGDMVFAMKCVRNSESAEGEPNLLVTASVAGEDTSKYSAQRGMEDNFVCVGVAVTEYRVSDPMGKNNSDDPDHGLTVTLAGIANMLNNGPVMIYAGQMFVWRFPPSPLSTYAPVNGMDNRFDAQINKRARGGTQPTQFRPEVVPFDYSDFTMHIAGAVASCQYPKANGLGISDMPLSDFFKSDGITEAPSYSCAQEEAAGHKYGNIGIVLAGLEVLAQRGLVTINTGTAVGAGATDDQKRAIADSLKALAVTIGLWEIDGQNNRPVFLEMLENMFFMDLPVSAASRERKQDFQTHTCGNETALKIAVRQNYRNDTNLNYMKLRLHLSRFTSTCLVGTWYSKTSKILGRALKTAAASETMPSVLGHTIMG